MQVQRAAKRLTKGLRRLDTRDLEQDAYLRCLPTLARYDGSTTFATFSFLRIRGAMIDGLRQWDNRRPGHRRFYWEPLSPEVCDTLIDPEPAADRQVLYTELRAHVGRLDPRSQRVIDALYREEKRMREVADELGLSLSRVSQLHREALAALRVSLQAPIADN